MFKSVGKLEVSGNPFKIIVAVDKGLADFYRSLIPKSVNLQPQRYAPHITVARHDNVSVTFDLSEYVEFEYSNYIFNNHMYYWLEVRSELLKQIRRQLDLPLLSELTKSPDGKHDFHITLGNLKGK